MAHLFKIKGYPQQDYPQYGGGGGGYPNAYSGGYPPQQPGYPAQPPGYPSQAYYPQTGQQQDFKQPGSSIVNFVQ